MNEANEAKLEIVPMRDEQDAEECARLMSTSDPWITLGRSYEQSLRILSDPSREVYVALSDGRLSGFLILCMTGAFIGYIQTICIHPDFRRQGLGTRLIRFAEERIFAETANVFMCVSSFNTEAKRLYIRLGYETVGELRDYVVAGHSEILLRKTTGPIKR